MHHYLFEGFVRNPPIFGSVATVYRVQAKDGAANSGLSRGILTATFSLDEVARVNGIPKLTIFRQWRYLKCVDNWLRCRGQCELLQLERVSQGVVYMSA